MKYRIFQVALFLAATTVLQGCSESVAGPFDQSRKQCKSWSSLKCLILPSKSFLRERGVKYRKWDLANGDQMTLKDFLGSRVRNFDRIRYLNGWDDTVTPDTVIDVHETEHTRVATDGFLPEEFAEHGADHQFSSRECEQQIREGKDNGVRCEQVHSLDYSGSVGSFLENIKGKGKVTEEMLSKFIEDNELPTSTTRKARLERGTWYEVGVW